MTIKWVDVNKGDKVHPNYRSRIVAKEFNVGKREDLFAATPPLEAKKMLFSMAVTEGVGHQSGNQEEGMKIDFIHITAEPSSPRFDKKEEITSISQAIGGPKKYTINTTTISVLNTGAIKPQVL